MNSRTLQIVLLFFLLPALQGCATMQPTDAEGPRNTSQYPILLVEDSVRAEATVLALRRLSQMMGTFQAADAKLQPTTNTVASLSSTTGPLYLPKVGAQAVMNEEETRESLRRFIREWQEIIGSDPAKLSLVQRRDQPDGTKVATYEQRPFRYPIRGNYGKLEIRFTADRRIINVSSTCVPDADRMQTALASATIKLKPEDAVAALRANEISYTDANGTLHTFRVAPNTQLNPRELVTYIEPSKTQAGALEFRLAWEIELIGTPAKLAYVDAVSGQVIAAQ